MSGSTFAFLLVGEQVFAPDDDFTLPSHVSPSVSRPLRIPFCKIVALGMYHTPDDYFYLTFAFLLVREQCVAANSLQDWRVSRVPHPGSLLLLYHRIPPCP